MIQSLKNYISRIQKVFTANKKKKKYKMVTSIRR